VLRSQSSNAIGDPDRVTAKRVLGGNERVDVTAGQREQTTLRPAT
jgi:hypothetical protein